MNQMKEILNKGGTPVFNTYAVEIGDALWENLYTYLRNSYPNPEDGYCSKYCIEGIYEEGSQKFAILRESSDSKLYRLDFSITEEGFLASSELIEVTKTFTPTEKPQFDPAAIEAYIANLRDSENAEIAVEGESEPQIEEVAAEPVEAEAEAEVVEEVTTESVEEEKPEPAEEEKEEEQGKVDEEENNKKEYNLEEIEEYTTLKNEFETLQANYNALEEKFNLDEEQFEKFKTKHRCNEQNEICDNRCCGKHKM